MLLKPTPPQALSPSESWWELGVKVPQPGRGQGALGELTLEEHARLRQMPVMVALTLCRRVVLPFVAPSYVRTHRTIAGLPGRNLGCRVAERGSWEIEGLGREQGQALS